MKFENYYKDVQLTLHVDNLTFSLSQPPLKQTPDFKKETMPENVIEIICKKGSECLNTNLSKKEAYVLALSAEGKTASEIAEVLHVSVNTVNFHIKNCLEKLKAKNKTHAVAKAILLNLLSL